MHGMNHKSQMYSKGTLVLLTVGVLTPLTTAQDNALHAFTMSLHQHAQGTQALPAVEQQASFISLNWDETDAVPETVVRMLGNTASRPPLSFDPSFGYSTNLPQAQPGQQAFNGFTGFRPKVDDLTVAPLPSGVLAGIGMLACLGGLRLAHRHTTKG
jgi:hypothetical protein